VLAAGEGGGFAWSQEIQRVPVELALPVGVTNTMDRFRGDAAFRRAESTDC
jgi:hypothetical protein